MSRFLGVGAGPVSCSSPSLLCRRAVRVALCVSVALTSICGSESQASDVLRYRAIPIAEVLVAVSDGHTGSIGECARWPAPSEFGSGARFRFISPSRIIGTVGVPLANGSSVRRAIVMEYDVVTGRWVSRELPLPAGALESIAMDANESGVVVGGCVFPEDQVHQSRIIGCVWHTTPLSHLHDSAVLLLDREPLCPEQGGVVHSVFTAVGPTDSDSVCFIAGVADRACQTGGPLPFGVSVRQGVLGGLETAIDVDLCLNLAEYCNASSNDDLPMGYSDAVGWDAVKFETQVLGSDAITKREMSSACVDAPAWVGRRWSPQSGETAAIRTPSNCMENGQDPTRVVLPDGTLAVVRSVQVSSVGALRDAEEGFPIAAGALGMEASDWGPCQSHHCFPVHAAVFVNPFAATESVVTVDIHQSIVRNIGELPNAFQSSAVARIESTLSRETDWMAVGARAEDDHPTSNDSEGVIWVGRMGDPSQEWCGRSMCDVRVTQCRAFWGSSEPRQVGSVRVQSVHDLRINGVAVGIGSVVASEYPSESQLLLLTEACDINGDLSVDRRDLVLLMKHWREHGNPCDLTGDGTVGDSDLKILLQAIGGDSVGRRVLIEDICGEYWAKTPPLPYTAAAYAFGFQDFSEFGDYAAALDPDQAVVLGCSVTVVAQALQEQGE